MIKIDPLITTTPTAPTETSRDEVMLERAKEFEAVFVAQMLKHSGFEKALSTDSGLGGENYASMLLSQYAARIVDNGGFGLADKIYEQMKTKEAAGGNERIV